ncbi:ABC transporter permease [Actinoplanes solisilvae]|uniref:ABC transporter permease n=1 Tax=Actinoplanes solisilvae TaxID=2486853 RepID=UPI000FD77031|nr:FtsX-like permease family protein [Actinoplanes solisilvae]
MIRATLAGLRARKLRLVLSGSAVVIGVMFVSAAFVLTGTLGRAFDALYTGVGEDFDVRVTARQLPGVGDEAATRPVPDALVARTAAVAGVATATGVVSEDGARLIGHDGKTVPAPLGRARLGNSWTGEHGPIRLRAGHGPASPGEIAISAALADAAGVRVGDRVGVLTQRPKRVFTIVGIIGYTGGRDSLGGTHEIAFHPSEAADLMLSRSDVHSAIDIRVDAGVRPDELRGRLSIALGDDYLIETGYEVRAAQAAAAKEDLALVNQILLGVGGMTLFAGVFLVLNTFSILIAQRTRELALLRALGARRRQVVGSVLLEAALTGAIASVLGLGLGVGVGALLAGLADSIGAGGLDLILTVPPAAVVTSLVVGVLVTLLAALAPALRASRVPPMAALREAATPDRSLLRLTVAGAVVAAAGAAVIIVGFAGGTEDPSLAAVLGGVLVSFVGFALLTPAVARPATRLLGRPFARSVPGRLGRLNAGRNPRRTAATASALMVGIALVTGVNVVLTSATASFDEQAGDYFRTDLIITGVASTERPPTFDPAVLGRARELSGVAGVSGQYTDVVQIGDRRVGVAAWDDDAALLTSVKVDRVAGSLGPLGPGEVVVDVATATAQGATVGSALTVTFSSGQRRTLTVIGTYTSDFSSGWVLPRASIADMASRQPTFGMVRLAPGASKRDVRAGIDALLTDSPEITVTDRTGFVGILTGVFRTVMLFLQILLGLILVIAILGIINTLAMSIMERTREFGLVRVAGLDRGQTIHMITVEAVVISVFGTALGTAVGVGLGAAVVATLRSEGIQKLALPWPYLGAYLVLGAVIGVIAAILPALRAARVDVLRAIAYE